MCLTVFGTHRAVKFLETQPTGRMHWPEGGPISTPGCATRSLDEQEFCSLFYGSTLSMVSRVEDLSPDCWKIAGSRSSLANFTSWSDLPAAFK